MIILHCQFVLSMLKIKFVPEISENNKRYYTTTVHLDTMQRSGKRISLDHLYEKSPPDTIRVTRTSRWGNPFKLSDTMSREESLKRFEAHLKQCLKEAPDFLDPLSGKYLACFCNLEDACHVDILLKYVE